MGEQGLARVRRGWQGLAGVLLPLLTLAYPCLPLLTPVSVGAEPGGTTPAGYTTAVTMSGAEMETQLFNWLEELLPVFVVIFDDQLARYIEAAGREKLTRQYTEKEFMKVVVPKVKQQFKDQISDLEAQIHRDGIVGSGKIRIGQHWAPVRMRVGVKVVNDRPHAVIHDILCEGLATSSEFRKRLEKRVNQRIDQQRMALKVKRYELNEGWAMITVEL